MNVMIVGAGGAIGSAVVRRFAAAGCHVTGVDISDAALDRAAGLSARIVCDLMDDEQLRALAAQAAQTGLDCVITTHGIDGSCPLDALHEDFYQKVLNINTIGTYRLFRALFPLLKASRGSFTVVVSQAGLKPEANNVAYCASKYALSGWIRSIASEAARTGVAVRGICPGCIGTPLYYAAQVRFAASISMPLADWLAHRDRNIPLGRIASTDEIAECLWFLAAPGKKRPTLLAPTGGETLL